MNKIIKPNLIFIIKTSVISADLLPSIKSKITDTPIMCLCGEGDLSAKRLEGDNMHIVFRPIKNSDLHARIREITGEIYDDKPAEETFDGLFVKKDKHPILAIDDNPMVLRGLKQLLDVEYDVTLATSFEAAKKHLETKKFDLILLDYEMPGTDGLEAYKYFVSEPKTMTTPIVFLTGVSDKKRIAEVVMLDPKPAGYLLKPIDAVILMDTLKKVLP